MLSIRCCVFISCFFVDVVLQGVMFRFLFLHRISFSLFYSLFVSLLLSFVTTIAIASIIMIIRMNRVNKVMHWNKPFSYMTLLITVNSPFKCCRMRVCGILCYHLGTISPCFSNIFCLITLCSAVILNMVRKYKVHVSGLSL